MDNSRASTNTVNRVSELTGQFRVTHLLYIVTLFGVSFGAFGPLGLVPGLCVAAFWTTVYVRRSWRSRIVNSLVLFAGFSCCGGLLVPQMGFSRTAAKRMMCSNNVNKISLALYNYHDQYKQFPPAHIDDADGRPMHSWRVLLLPFLEQENLYKQYRFDEPWDGLNNRKLLASMPSIYSCPAQDDSPYTSYVAVIGPDTAWPDATSRKLADIADPHDQTILFVESAEPRILWMEPRDLTYEDALAYLSGTTEIVRHDAHWNSGYFDEQFMGRMIATADGSVQFVAGLLGPDHWARLISINDGGGPVNLRTGATSPTRYRYANYARLAAWILVVLWPAPYLVAGKLRRNGR